MQSEQQEFNLIKIRSATDPRSFTVKQPFNLKNNELNEFKMQQYFPKKLAIIHCVLLLSILITQIALQVVELNINSEFSSGIYSGILTSVYGISTVIVLFCLSIFIQLYIFIIIIDFISFI
jgi:hypothetical protein